MKRIVYWLLSTVTVVVLLFGYRTSLAGPLARQGKTVASSPPPAAALGSTTAGTASRTVTGPVATALIPGRSSVSPSKGLNLPAVT